MLELTNRSGLQLITENILFVCTLRRLMVFALWMLGHVTHLEVIQLI